MNAGKGRPLLSVIAALLICDGCGTTAPSIRFAPLGTDAGRLRSEYPLSDAERRALTPQAYIALEKLGAPQTPPALPTFGKTPSVVLPYFMSGDQAYTAGDAGHIMYSSDVTFPGAPFNTDTAAMEAGPESAGFLNLLIRTMSATAIVEVGTSFGYTALWLGEAARATGGH